MSTIPLIISFIAAIRGGSVVFGVGVVRRGLLGIAVVECGSGAFQCWSEEKEEA
jgi:hypothetical protein